MVLRREAGEEGVFHVLAWCRLLLEADAALLGLGVAVVEIVTVDEVLTFSCLLLLSWQLDVRNILRLLFLTEH